MKQTNLETDLDELIIKLREEHEYWYNSWNAKECDAGNCRLIKLALVKLAKSRKLISEIM